MVLMMEGGKDLGVRGQGEVQDVAFLFASKALNQPAARKVPKKEIVASRRGQGLAVAGQAEVANALPMSRELPRFLPRCQVEDADLAVLPTAANQAAAIAGEGQRAGHLPLLKQFARGGLPQMNGAFPADRRHAAAVRRKHHPGDPLLRTRLF